MLSNKEISEIFQNAGIKNHRLLNKERSKYTEFDYQVLETIRNGVKLENPFYIKKGYPHKRIIRLSDGEIFETVNKCAEANEITPAKLYGILHHKNPDLQTFRYLE